MSLDYFRGSWLRQKSATHQCTAGCRIVLQEVTPLCRKLIPARLEARISVDLHSMLKRAAQLQGRTMTDFVVAAVQTAARDAIEQQM